MGRLHALGRELATCLSWPRPRDVAFGTAPIFEEEHHEPSIIRRGTVGIVLASTIVSPKIAEAAAHGSGGGPVIERQHYTDYLAPDDFFIDLCGIVTNTTVKELDILKTWPDGSQSFHVERSFIPEDPRLPIERGAGTSYFAPDGTMIAIKGKPIQLIGADGGVRAVDAGLTLLGDPTVVHGHNDVGIDNEDLAPFYCRPSGS